MNHIDNNKPNSMPINKDFDSDERVPFTWEQLKDFCNNLTDEQLSKTVYVSQEDSSIEILYASELGDDHYKFDEEEYSFSKADFDKLYHFDGKYETFEQALESEPYIFVPGTNVYLFDI